MTAYPIPENAKLYDPSQVEEYLATIFRHVDWQAGQVISLLGIGEKGTPQEGVFRDRQIVPPGFLGLSHGHLKRWAEYHVAGFIVPAVLHATAQAKGDVTLDKVAQLTALILDLDNGDIAAKLAFVTDRLGVPTLTIASGGRTDGGQVKVHAYWLLSEPSDEVERVAAMRKLLAAKVGGDQSFGRATQVIRIPGTVHAKNGNAAVCSILTHTEFDYNFDELAEIIETMEPMPGVELVTIMPPLPMSGGSLGNMMDFTPRQDTAAAAMHRDIAAGGDDLTRWGEFNKIAGFNISCVRQGSLTPEAAYTATSGWMLTHMDPPWPQARLEQEFEALVRKDIANHGPFPQSMAARVETVEAKMVAIQPSPATWPFAQTIPPRPWLFGRWLQRGIVTAMIAPGGVGKSSLTAAMMLSLTSGKPLLGKRVYGGPLRAWYWNLEDGGDNLARARIAASMHHGVTEADCGGRLYVDSGPEGATLCTAVEDKNGFTVIVPVMENITAAIIRLGIDVLVIDPFVSSHQVNENDNNKIDAVAKAWARVAQLSGCSIVLVHHSVKMRGEAVTADSSRGAGALNNAARMTLVLNRMTAEQADKWGIEFGSEARYFSVADDKHNLSAAERADWFKIESVCLNNGNDIHEADSIGVVTSWEPPKTMDGVTVQHLAQVQSVLGLGTYWFDVQTVEGWAGDVVGRIVGIETAKGTPGRQKANGIMQTWIKSGALKIDLRERKKPGQSPHPTKCVIPGTPAIVFSPVPLIHDGE